MWFSEDAIAGWRAEGRTTPGGQPHYSALAILTGLCLRAVGSVKNLGRYAASWIAW